MLAQDPASRVPEGWELLRPVPPPSPDPDEFAADARIPLADRELRLPGQVAGELDAIHVYRGRMHKECLSAMSFVFRSEEFTAPLPRAVVRRVVRAVRPAARLRHAPARAAGPAAPITQRALGAEVTRARECAADPARGVPRRAPGDHPPRPAHGARVAHQPRRHAALGAQRPGRLRRHRPLPRGHVDHRARRPRDRVHRRHTRSCTRAPRPLRRLRGTTRSV